MVAKRVRTYCPLSDRTTQEVSELTAMLSGLVQQRVEQNALLTAMLRHNGSERPVPAPAKAARQLALLAHQAASGTPVNSPEVSDLKAMILGLVKQGAEH